MNRNFDLDKEYEYVKNKESALSHSATDMIKKILLIEDHFKKGQLFFIKDDTTFNFSIDDYSNNDGHYLAKRATVLFKSNVKYINSEQEDIDPENFKHLKEINSRLLNEFYTIYIQSYDELRHKDEKTVTEMLKNKIEQTLYSMGFSREITLENRFDFYSDSLLFSLDEHLHPHIPDFINSLKNNYDYTLKLDVFGEEIVFLTNNFKEVYFFDDEEIAFIDDLSEAFFFYKEVEHIQMLFNQIRLLKPIHFIL